MYGRDDSKGYQMVRLVGQSTSTTLVSCQGRPWGRGDAPKMAMSTEQSSVIITLEVTPQPDGICRVPLGLTLTPSIRPGVRDSNNACTAILFCCTV